MRLGVGYRHQLASWLAQWPRNLSCVELTAEHFYDAPERLEAFCTWRGQSPSEISCYIHGLGLSLGTPGPLDQQRLSRFANVANACRADWVSEHVAFTRTSETDLGHLNPVPPTRECLKCMVEHALELSDRCRKPLLMENITSHIRLQGQLSETEFLNELCRGSGCGLLLDVTNLYVNSRNHGFDALQWLGELEPTCIQQLHIVGYSQRDQWFFDDHSKAIQPELLDLARAVIERAPVKAIILERDSAFPDDVEINAELAKLENLCDAN
jgi:uncharacterized protein